MRALRYIALIAATQAALYSDETYDKLRRLFGRVSRQAPSTAVSSLDSHYQKVETALNEATRKRLDDLLKDTTTEKCREEVTSTFIDSYKRQISEDWLPFERTGYVSDCPSQRDNAPRAPRLRAEDIRLAYLLVVHETPQQITRLIEALEEGTRHNFIIHVDDKPQSQATYNYLLKYASTRAHVHVLETGRQSVSWGGFNVVQATLNGLAYALDVLEGQFDWIITASGYTYPLASNRRIREELARHPSDTEFLEIRPQPNDPMPRAWHQFVECDGKMRRITRLLPPRKIKMYMGSQWMVVTRDFAAYATGRESPRQRRSFASQYAPYGKYTMVADENFFTTARTQRPVALAWFHFIIRRGRGWFIFRFSTPRAGPEELADVPQALQPELPARPVRPVGGGQGRGAGPEQVPATRPAALRPEPYDVNFGLHARPRAGRRLVRAEVRRDVRRQDPGRDRRESVIAGLCWLFGEA